MGALDLVLETVPLATCSQDPIVTAAAELLHD